MKKVNNLIMRYFCFIKNTFYGRVGRGDYFAGDILFMSAIFLIFFIFLTTIPIISELNKNNDLFIGISLIGATFLVLNVAIIWLGLNVRRLHDFGYSGWAFVLAFFPLLNIVIGLMALFRFGNVKENEYGNIPDKNKNLIKRILNLN